MKSRYFIPAALGLLAMASPSSAATLAANFDSIPEFTPLGTTYAEGGITFSSPSPFEIANRSVAAVMFGWGGYTYPGNALSVHNNGWVSISAPGYNIDRVSFQYGFDWNGYLIEYGLMDTTFGWQALLAGAVVDSGSTTWGRHNRTHGNIMLSVTAPVAFDTLQIRSTAVAYEAVPWVGANPQGWYFDRGAVVGYGDANHIAFDTVSLQTRPATASEVQVPDSGTTISLFAFACLALGFINRIYRRGSCAIHLSET